MMTRATMLLARWWMPPNAAAHGIAVDRLLHWNLTAVGICFLIGQFLLLVLLLRRPSSSTCSSVPRSWKLQLVPITVFCLLYMAMAVAAQQLWARDRFEGAAPASMQVEVTARQFQWYFRYPGANATFGQTDPAFISPASGNPLGLVPGDANGADDIIASELVLPVQREVDITLRAQDVIHGFFIPAMRLKQNALPGQVIHVHFTPIAAGIYPIVCTQVCGLGHARMQARLRVVSDREFAQWLHAKAHP